MKKLFPYLIFIICIPLVIAAGAIFFQDKQYAFITIAITLLSIVPFFVSFERKQHTATKLVLIAVMVALSVVGRMLFFYVPGFKPVTAMVIITAIYFGGEAGFMTGALTALISNFFFGQGPWTPFQMFTWGLIGFAAGIFSEKLKNSKILLCIYGVLSGVVYSLLLDMWQVLWLDSGFNISRYLAMVVSSAGFTLLYAVSNVIFLFLLTKPIGSKIERVKEKYGII